MSTLSDTSQSNIGWVYPPQPQTVVSTIEEVIGVVNGTVQLVEGQDYIDVVFGSAQPNENWVLLEVSIFNLTDVAPLNVWPGVMTSKTSNGFRVQLNGTADSGNYYLTWSIRGVFGYYLTGPTSSRKNVASTPFTVRLPDETTLVGTVVITPNDGGVGGTFTPSTVSLTAAEPSATFTYTPTTYGARSIGVTNNRGLVEPPQIGFTSLAANYTLTGPSTGNVGDPSTDFTVALPAGGVVSGTVTVTPHDAGDGGTFTPTTVELTTAAPSATFTYTPASSGTKTISVTNDGGLTNPANLSYEAVAPFSPLDIAGCTVWMNADDISAVNGEVLTAWSDSSGNGHDMAITAPDVTFRTNVLNGKPVVRFGPPTYGGAYIASILLSQPTTWFVVAKGTSKPSYLVFSFSDQGVYLDASGYAGIFAGSSALDSVDLSGAFHIYEAIISGSNGTLYVDGTFKFGPSAVGANGPNGVEYIMGDGVGSGSQGDIAEIILYNSALGATDRENVEDYLKAKYGIA